MFGVRGSRPWDGGKDGAVLARQAPVFSHQFFSFFFFSLGPMGQAAHKKREKAGKGACNWWFGVGFGSALGGCMAVGGLGLRVFSEDPQRFIGTPLA